MRRIGFGFALEQTLVRILAIRISQEVGILLKPDCGSVNTIGFTVNLNAEAPEPRRTAGISPLIGA